MRGRINVSPQRALALGVILLIELGVCVWFFQRELLTALLLFALAALITIPAFAILLRCWPRATRPRQRFGLCLLVAFVAYEIAVLLFALVEAIIYPGDFLPWLGIVLFAANFILFPIWIGIGTIAYVLLRFLVPPGSSALASETGSV